MTTLDRDLFKFYGGLYETFLTGVLYGMLLATCDPPVSSITFTYGCCFDDCAATFSAAYQLSMSVKIWSPFNCCPSKNFSYTRSQRSVLIL